MSSETNLPNGTPDVEQTSEQRSGEDRRGVDRRVCDRRLLFTPQASTPQASTTKPAANRRDNDRRDLERRTFNQARREDDTAPADQDVELRLEPQGSSKSRKISEITVTRVIPAHVVQENGTAVVDGLAREFHQEVAQHFRQNLPRVQLLRATIDCFQNTNGTEPVEPREDIEITLRATCLSRRKPPTKRKKPGR